MEEQDSVTVLWVGQERCAINPVPGTCGELTAHSTVHVQSQPSIATDSQGNAYVSQDMLARNVSNLV